MIRVSGLQAQRTARVIDPVADGAVTPTLPRWRSGTRVQRALLAEGRPDLGSLKARLCGLSGLLSALYHQLTEG